MLWLKRLDGFNPVWEESLSFTLHMAEVALVRFLVWDHDPIGRDFIGQRTVAFSSLMPGYRHVYLEGLTEASIFVHVSVHDVYGKGHQLRGIRGFFNRSSKSSVDTNTSGLRKRSISDHLLRRTASAPAKGRKKTKMALSESVASISEQKNLAGAAAAAGGAGGGAGGAGGGAEGSSGRDGAVEKRLQPRAPLIHRPISMPLDRLLQGQLSICSPEKEQQDINADIVVGGCLFNRPRSSSVDVVIESSFPIQPSVSSSSETSRKKEFGQSEEASYLVIGGEVRKEAEYANFPAEINRTVITETERSVFSSPNVKIQMQFDKPETSSISTTFTVAPSVSSSSSSALSSVKADCGDARSPGSVHDSAISRLIDAVSLDNGHDTCGSISALIGQFENTAEQNNFSLSHQSTPPHHSNCRHTSPKVEDSRCPLQRTGASPFKQLISPEKVAQISKRGNYGICSPCTIHQTDAPTPALVSSPETAELEEVYTILDEEVLLPVSVYNLKKQAVHVQADTTENRHSGGFTSSPAKAVQGAGNSRGGGWDDVKRKRDEAKESEEAEERVYEEVNDLPLTLPETSTGSKRFMSSSVSDCYQLHPDPAGNVFTEVELNVDEDPLERMLASPIHGSQWEGLTSPTKRHAIYQNHSYTSGYPQQKQPSYRHSPQEHASRSPHVAFPDLHSPGSQTSNHRRRLIDSRPSNHSPLRQNSYPVPQCNSEDLSHSRDFISPHKQQRSLSSNQLCNKPLQEKTLQEKTLQEKPLQGCKHTERDQAGLFHNGFSSSDGRAAQSAVSVKSFRDRNLYSPSSDSDAVYSHPKHDCVSSSPLSQNSQSQSPALPFALKQTWNQKVSHISTRVQTHAESRGSVQSDSGPLSRNPQPAATVDSSNPCKSKSLGDLTSEDISCNFQSKYHIISRSFITPHMRRQRRMGAARGEAFQQQSCDPLTEQLRRLVSLEGDDGDGERTQPPLSQPQSAAPAAPGGGEDSPPPLTRRLSSRSQSRVRHINSRARERQQEALKPRTGAAISNAASMGGVVLRSKPASQNPPANRHSTGSYIAGYFGQLEDRGLPEGACTSLLYGNGDQYGDRYHTDDSLQTPNGSASEPEVYFLLRL